MKKFILIAFLAVGTVGFAGNSEKAKKNKKAKAVACCTVGSYTECGYAWEDLCGKARRRYCAANPCSPATIATLPQN